MKRSELEGLANRLKDRSVGADDSDLDIERQDALDFYFGRNWKPAPEGRSQVVDRVFMDTVEWIMPQVMRVFASTDDIVKFEAIGPDDEQLAEQQTIYVNREIMKRDGFLVLYDAVKDALMMRNCYIKCFWEEKEKTCIESYRNLTPDDEAKLMADYDAEDAEVEVIEEEKDDQEMSDGNAVIKIPVKHLKLRVTTNKGHLSSVALPPEEVRVEDDATGSIQELGYIAWVTTKKRTELIEMGMDKEFVYSLPPAYDDDDEGSTSGRRDPFLADEEEIALDESMQEVEYSEAYMRVDYDGDGKAELRKVVLAGKKIPKGDEWIEEIDFIPIAYGSPIRIPHRHRGVGLFDLVRDLQEQRSTLKRQMFDNIYITNNQRPIISNRVSLRDLAVSKPGAPVGVDTDAGDVASHIQYTRVPSIFNQIVPAFEILDQEREERTGVGRNNMNIDPDVLKQSTDGAQERAFKAANAKIEMIIRLLAETLVKDWMKLALKLIIKHQDRPTTFKLTGDYVEVDPREWVERDDLTVSVGVGTGSEEEKQARLAVMGGIMERAAQAGIVLPNNVFNFATDSAKVMGFKQPTRYFTDPSSPEFQQLQQQQAMQAQEQAQQQAQMLERAEDVKGRWGMQEEHLKARAKIRETQIKAMQDTQKQNKELAFKLRELLQNRDLKTAEMEIDAFIEGLNVDIGEPGMGAELS